MKAVQKYEKDPLNQTAVFSIKHICLIFQITLLGMLAPAQTTSDTEKPKKHLKTMILKNARIIVGRDNLVQDNMTLVIEGKWIKKITANKQVEFGKEATVYDLSGQYIIPGLIESHNHSRTIGSEKPYTNALYCGITTIRDMGGDGAYLKSLQEAINSGEFLGPDIYFSALVGGETLIQNDRRVRMATPEKYKLGEAPWMREIGESTSIAKVISDAQDCGATGIKVYSHLSADLVQKLTAEALNQGLKVWAHAHVGPATVEDVLRAGVHSISHISFICFPSNWNLRQHGTVTFDEHQLNDNRLNSLFSTMKSNGTFLDPNFVMTLRDLDTKVHDKRCLEKKQTMIFSLAKKAHKAGVKMVAGTDIFLPKTAGVFPELHREMELMVNMVGMTPLEALEAATYNGAILLGIENTHGTVEVGKIANLVILKGDPLEDITNTKKINFVIKNGKHIETK